MITTLYRPPDVDEAYHEWSASCGPCALAALLGRPLADVRAYFPGHASRGGWANPTHLQSALLATGLQFTKRTGEGLPARGLAFLQVTGPWDAPGVPVAAAYRKTHWVATRFFRDITWQGEDEWVYDCNASQEDGTRGDWWPRPYWEKDVMSAIVAAHKRATGWRVRVAYEVMLPGPGTNGGNT